MKRGKTAYAVAALTSAFLATPLTGQETDSIPKHTVELEELTVEGARTTPRELGGTQIDGNIADLLREDLSLQPLVKGLTASYAEDFSSESKIFLSTGHPFRLVNYPNHHTELAFPDAHLFLQPIRPSASYKTADRAFVLHDRVQDGVLMSSQMTKSLAGYGHTSENVSAGIAYEHHYPRLLDDIIPQLSMMGNGRTLFGTMRITDNALVQFYDMRLFTNNPGFWVEEKKQLEQGFVTGSLSHEVFGKTIRAAGTRQHGSIDWLVSDEDAQAFLDENLVRSDVSVELVDDLGAVRATQSTITQNTARDNTLHRTITSLFAERAHSWDATALLASIQADFTNNTYVSGYMGLSRRIGTVELELSGARTVDPAPQNLEEPSLWLVSYQNMPAQETRFVEMRARLFSGAHHTTSAKVRRVATDITLLDGRAHGTMYFLDHAAQYGDFTIKAAGKYRDMQFFVDDKQSRVPMMPSFEGTLSARMQADDWYAGFDWTARSDLLWPHGKRSYENIGHHNIISVEAGAHVGSFSAGAYVSNLTELVGLQNYVAGRQNEQTGQYERMELPFVFGIQAQAQFTSETLKRMLGGEDEN